MNPYQVVRDFEKAVCDYTNAPYCVTVTSCTMALFLSLRWFYERLACCHPLSGPEWDRKVIVPKRTYVSVPMVVKHAGFSIQFKDIDWLGDYGLDPLPVIDSARLFTSYMYEPKTFRCVSFHASKTLGIEQGGAILHDDHEADVWLRKARFDGRTEGVPPSCDHFDMLGWHCYMSPSVAAQGLLKIHSLPKHNDPLPNDDYPDLSKFEIFNASESNS